MLTREVLLKVKNGEMSIEDAEKYFKLKPYEDMGYARLDTHRKIRSGFPEVIFCQGKSDEHLKGIFRKIYESEGEVLATRADLRQYELIRAEYPEAEYDSVTGILKIEKEKEHTGKVVVCSAGTADIPVAGEAAAVADFFGCRVVTLYDVGVCGIHRLLDNYENFCDASCIIAVAGMEGALASVIGGLVDCPVIAVPTSVGYGASFDGLSALLTMINSCANGIAVVNIDNGFGAGYIAAQINGKR